ncbi:hypothetical protein CIK83_10410 [Vibrio casei]|uniref:Uncharacterized protein n=1 Tax=Vibrio casei TaxID=673372 RepID=A0A368LH00_9VIBR|nr:hypothetical protein CIK83_10410 [Vibrio casei]
MVLAWFWHGSGMVLAWFWHGSGLKFVSASRINNRFQFHEYTNILLSLAMRNAASAPLVDK